MGILSTLFGSAKAAETGANVINRGMDAIDAIVYTKEEKVADQIKVQEIGIKAREQLWSLWHKTQEVIRDENSARAITRRFLAVLFCAAFVALLFWGVLIYGLHVAIVFFSVPAAAMVDPGNLQKVQELMPLRALVIKDYASYVAERAEVLAWIVGAVVTFYFGPYQVGRYLWRRKEGKSDDEVDGVTQ